MGAEWPEVPFPEVIDFREGPGILAKDFQDEGVPLVRLAGLDRSGSVLTDCNYLDPEKVAEKWEHFRLEKGDVLVSTSASLGRIAVVGDAGVGAIPYTGIIRMRPREGRLIAPFIRYLLEGPHFQRQAEMMGAGSVIRHFGPTHLRNMTVRIPPLHEQCAIAQILSAPDDKIELNQRVNQTLEGMARALFKSWFVDFDPVRAKMDGCWQPCETLPGLPAELYDMFPERLVESELGEVPEGWKPTPLGELATQRRQSRKPEDIDPGTPYIGLEHMPRGSIALPEWDTADGLASNKYQFDKGQILFGKLRPYFHKVGVAPVSGVCSTDIVVIEVSAPALFGPVLGCVSSPEFVAYTNSGATGTKMPRTSWSYMSRYPVVLPVQPEPVCQAFSGICDHFVARMDQSVHESRCLATLRDTLLPHLISGNLRVPDVDRFVEADLQ